MISEMDINRLIAIVDALRENCPWDKKQTAQSLKPYIIEEAYELLEAIDSGSPEDITEELGDLLLQIVFQGRLLREKRHSGLESVIDGICEKMVMRHPHVFGAVRLETEEEVLGQWEKIKRKEGKKRSSLLDGVPSQMPALLRSARIQSRAARVGFDWPKPEEVVSKLQEETAEFKEALALEDKDMQSEELGDMLFSIVNIARYLGINAEDALHRTTEKFMTRFSYIEKAASASGRDVEHLGLQEMEKLWSEAKTKK